MSWVACPSAVQMVDWMKPTIFVGGGISGCPDWQADVELMSDALDEVVFVSPRRDDFDILDQAMGEEQIAWEFENLRDATAVLFWFPSESICPITLFELGVEIGRKREGLFVGHDPEYMRRIDLEEQLSLARPEIVIEHDLEALVRRAVRWCVGRPLS